MRWRRQLSFSEIRFARFRSTCDPARTEGINLRGMYRFPIERYAEQLRTGV
jgi:hypothetical protein